MPSNTLQFAPLPQTHPYTHASCSVILATCFLFSSSLSLKKTTLSLTRGIISVTLTQGWEWHTTFGIFCWILQSCRAQNQGIAAHACLGFNPSSVGWNSHLNSSPDCLPEDFLLGWAKQTVSFDLSRLGQKVCFKPDRQGKLHLSMLADQGKSWLPCLVLSPLKCLKLLN